MLSLDKMECVWERETEFLVRRGQMQRSAKKMRMGCTLAYCPFAFIFDSGSRCAPYHKKFKKLSVKGAPEHILKLRNI